MILAGAASMRSAETTYDLQSAARLFVHAASLVPAVPMENRSPLLSDAIEGVESAISRARNMGVREAVQSEPRQRAKKGWFPSW